MPNQLKKPHYADKTIIKTFDLPNRISSSSNVVSLLRLTPQLDHASNSIVCLCGVYENIYSIVINIKLDINKLQKFGVSREVFDKKRYHLSV